MAQKSSALWWVVGSCKSFYLVGMPLREQFKQSANPFVEPENKRKADEGIVSMRRRKTAQRAELKAKKDEENKMH